MSNALIADISGYQNPTIGPSYWAWSSAGDGTARLICKATEGVGFKDKNFEGYWQQATAAGAGMIVPYHYARPDLNPGTAGAANEARWFASVIGNRLRPGDRLMLDFEQNEDAAWARTFYAALTQALPLSDHPVLYDSVSHFNQFFAGDLWLAQMYDCALASWHLLAQGPPPAPAGWTMLWWQYADNETVPGIGVCDANLWLGGSTMVPEGWTDDGTTLTAPNGVQVSGLFREAVIAAPWRRENVPAGPAYAASPLTISDPTLGAGQRQDFEYDSLGSVPSIDHAFFLGLTKEIAVLKAQPPAGTAKLVIDSTSIRAVLA